MPKIKITAKRMLILVLAVFTLSMPVSGAAVDGTVSMPKVYAMDNYQSRIAGEGGLLFLFSRVSIDHEHTGTIYVIGGSVELSADVNGRVYVLFADCILSGGVPSNGVSVFSGRVLEQQGGESAAVRDLGFGIMDTYPSGGYGVRDFSIPSFLLRLAFCLFEICACFALYAAKKSFVEQGAALPSRKFPAILSNGVLAYFFLLVLVLLFVMSVYLIPLALILVIAAYCVLLAGQASLAIALSYAVTKRLKWDTYAYVHLLAGLGVIELLKCTPYVSWVIFAFAVPVLTLGAFVGTVRNGYIKKRFYVTPFKEEPQQKRLDNSAVRDIILKKEQYCPGVDNG